MLHLLYFLLATARSSLKAQRELALENVALRQQLAILQRKTKRPKLTKVDRAFWPDLVSIDFFVVPTATFRILYVFLVLEHERRSIVHFNVTDGPSAQLCLLRTPSTAQSLMFPRSGSS